MSLQSAFASKLCESDHDGPSQLLVIFSNDSRNLTAQLGLIAPDGVHLRAVCPSCCPSVLYDDDDSENKSVKMLRRELGIWRRLRHKNIVPFLGIAYGFGMCGTIALVSSWMPNETLHKFLETHDDKLEVVHRLQILLDIASGQQYLHSFPIAHGDLNCNNVLLDADYTARLSDFGYASLVGNAPEAFAYLQRSTARPGALRWIAPEQVDLEGSFNRTIKSDVYSFGCVALQVLSGKPPWSEVREEASIVLRLHLGHKPGRPEFRKMDDAHWNFVQFCWSSPQERPTADTITHSIQELSGHHSSSLVLPDLIIPQPSQEVSATSQDWDSSLLARVDRFSEGPHYGPVLQPFLAKVVGATIKLNPLLAPPADAQGDYLWWNMLFHIIACYRTTEPRQPWAKGRNEPATHPRLTHIRIICRAYPWMIHAHARDPKLGISCGDVLDAIYVHVCGIMTKSEYEDLTVAKKRQIWDSYKFNRSTDPNVPGRGIGEGLRRVDMLGSESRFGGLVVNDMFVKEHCGDVLPCTFELKCLPVVRC